MNKTTMSSTDKIIPVTDLNIGQLGVIVSGPTNRHNGNVVVGAEHFDSVENKKVVTKTMCVCISDGTIFRNGLFMVRPLECGELVTITVE